MSEFAEPAPARGPFVILLLMGAGLRLAGLTRDGIWFDEAYSAIVSRLPLSGMISALEADSGPPLLYLLLKCFPFTGSGLFWLRFPGALVSIATLPVAYLLGRRLGGSNVGLWAMALVALSPLQIYYAQEARFYPFLALAASGAVLGMVAWYQGGTRWALPVYGVSCLGVLYLHYVGLFFVAGSAAVMLWLSRRKGRPGLIVSIHGLLGILVLPWLPVLLTQFRTGGSAIRWMEGFWLAYPPPLAVFRTLESYSILPKTPAFVGLNHAAAAAPWIAVMMVATAGFGLAVREYRERGGGVVCAVFLTTLLSVFAYSFLQPVYLAGRTDSFLFPLWAVLLACGLERLSGRAPLARMVVLAALVVAALSVQVDRFTTPVVDAGREGAEWLLSVSDASDSIILCGPDTATVDFSLGEPDGSLRRRFFPQSLNERFVTTLRADDLSDTIREASGLEAGLRAGSPRVWIVGVEGALLATLIEPFRENGWMLAEKPYRFLTRKKRLAVVIVGLENPSVIAPSP